MYAVAPPAVLLRAPRIVFSLHSLCLTAAAAAMAQDVTYLFELCCKANRVVTAYPTDRGSDLSLAVGFSSPRLMRAAYLLAARNIVTGCCLSDSELDALGPNMGVLRPAYISFASLGLKSLNVSHARLA